MLPWLAFVEIFSSLLFGMWTRLAICHRFNDFYVPVSLKGCSLNAAITTRIIKMNEKNTYLRNNNLAWLSALVKHKVYAPKRWVLWILQWALRPASCAGVSKKWARIYTRFLRLLMAASTILWATSKQLEKPRKLVGALLQTFYIIRSRTDSSLALKSAGIFSAGEGFPSLILATGSICLPELDTDPRP